MNYQWYPGHMTKARRMMQEDSRLIDLVIELVDARVPMSSRNPDIDEIVRGKSRIVLLNKADLADKRYNSQWIDYFEKKGFYALEINARSGAGIKNIMPLVQKACQEKMERDRKRGIVNRPVRAMVAGIPNVGKSTFINSFAGKACTKTGNKPGVTKGKQWIRLNKNLELLDTPGILWPKFEDQKTGERLAMIGSISDEILEPQELAIAVIAYLQREYPQLLQERYGVGGTGEHPACAEDARSKEAGEHPACAEDVRSKEAGGQTVCGSGLPKDGERGGVEAADMAKARELLREICIARRCFQKGETPDLPRAARLLLDDFRNGRIGRITLEYPEEWT